MPGRTLDGDDLVVVETEPVAATSREFDEHVVAVELRDFSFSLLSVVLAEDRVDADRKIHGGSCATYVHDGRRDGLVGVDQRALILTDSHFFPSSVSELDDGPVMVDFDEFGHTIYGEVSIVSVAFQNLDSHFDPHVVECDVVGLRRDGVVGSDEDGAVTVNVEPTDDSVREADGCGRFFPVVVRYDVGELTRSQSGVVSTQGLDRHSFHRLGRGDEDGHGRDGVGGDHDGRVVPAEIEPVLKTIGEDDQGGAAIELPDLTSSLVCEFPELLIASPDLHAHALAGIPRLEEVERRRVRLGGDEQQVAGVATVAVSELVLVTVVQEDVGPAIATGTAFGYAGDGSEFTVEASAGDLNALENPQVFQIDASSFNRSHA